MTRLRERLPAFDNRALNVLLALAIGTEIVLECWLDSGIAHAHRLPSTLAAVFLVAPITVRRRWPAAALVAAAVIDAIQAPLGGDLGATTGVGTLVTMAVLAYSLGNRRDGRSSVAALVVAGAISTGHASHTTHGLLGWAGSELFILSVAFGAPWLIGRVTRRRDRRVAAFRALVAKTKTAHDESKRAAVAHERDRIGRELEDIIAHSVSAMVIQAGGARQLLREDAEQARNSILTVERTGREALADLRRLLGMLRKDDDTRTLAPQPGLDQLTALITSLRARGLICQLHTDGEPVDLTPGIDLVSYRLIETTLFSAANQPGSHAAVTLIYNPAELDLDIHGDAATPNLEETLHGMTERIALYEGTLNILRAADGGFALHATLPLGAPVPA